MVEAWLARVFHRSSGSCNHRAKKWFGEQTGQWVNLEKNRFSWLNQLFQN
jgi:hypothetical protein